MAIALAVAVGARVVVTSSSDEKISTARELGAHDGVRHDESDWVSKARTLTTDGAGFDVVLDAVGRWEESVAALRPGGRLVVLGASAADEARLAIRPFYFGQFDLLGTTMGSPADLAGLLALLAEHRVAPAGDRPELPAGPGGAGPYPARGRHRFRQDRARVPQLSGAERSTQQEVGRQQ